MNWAAIAAIGLVVGFLSGLFGKGGSAIATPLLHAAGVPAIVAVASPLPAAIPSTLAAESVYLRHVSLDRRVVAWTLAFGIPATLVGAYLTRWIGGNVLLRVTDVLIAGLGVRLLVRPGRRPLGGGPLEHERLRLAAVAVLVGLISGLLANSGGFLLAPLYLVVLHLRLKRAFAASLAVAMVLAIPGTLVHWALGHIDWAVVVVFGAAAVPFSFLGARVAVRADAKRLERLYGAVLLVLGVAFLLATR